MTTNESPRQLIDVTTTTADNRRDVLSQFGHRLPSAAKDLNDVLTHGDCNYEARTVPSFAKIGGKFVKDPNSFHVVRGDTDKIIGRVGKKFRVVQNADAFAVAEELVKQGIGTFDLVGHFRDAVPFVTVNLKPRKIGRETLEPRIMFCHGLDGSRGITAAFMAERLFCTNQLPVADKPYNIRHTKTAGIRLSIAQKMVMQFEANLKRLETAMPLMEKRILTGKERNDFFFKAYGIGNDPEKRETFETKTLYHLDRLSVEGLGNSEVEGSVWAAYNAVTEFEDWSKGYSRKGTFLSNKVESMYFGDASKRKFKALSEALALVS